eukprot:9970358-Prorocentrum_lima.AAC.1
MDSTIARASASELGYVRWVTKNQFLAHQQYTEGVASGSERLVAWEQAIEDQKIEKRGSVANPTVA